MTAPAATKAERLAQTALNLAVANASTARIAGYVQRISRECGPEGVMAALVCWCDTYIDHATDGRMAPDRLRIESVQAATGEAAQAPEILWSGRLLSARSAMDPAEFLAVMQELPPNRGVVDQHVAALLVSVATSLNALPRGFGTMTRG